MIVLISKQYNFLQKEAKRISDAIAGPNANNEMRIAKYFNQEINGKREEIIASLRTKSFFPGPKIIILNGLPEKDFKIILEIESAWQKDDAITIVTTNNLPRNQEFRKLLESSIKIIAINYTENKVKSEVLSKKLAEKGLKFEGEEVLGTLIEFANFTSEDMLDNELEKLKLFKLYDDKPITNNDFFDIVSINYEIDELSLAVAVADRNIVEVEKKLSLFYSRGNNLVTMLQFLSAYFYKLSLIKMYGPTSFEVKREYPFLVTNDLEKAKIHVKRWSSEQLKIVTNCITISDLKLRKYHSVFQRSIITQCLNKIMDV